MQIGHFPRRFDRLFDPRAIAVVGASNFPGKWGFVMPMSIIGGGYSGDLYMVNPNEDVVLGMRSHRSLLEIDAPVDLAVVTVPARLVGRILEDAAEKGVPNLLVVASNFSEVGEEGAALERELALYANQQEITIIGPNTMGIFSATSSLCALGAPVFPMPGRVGFVSQSGNLGVQLLNWGKRRGVGFSRFIGSGNEANTEATDYLEFFAGDPETDLVALYLEGLEDGRRFLEVAGRVTPEKPVVVLKGGKGKQGGRAVSSHSGALAGTLELYDGMFEQAGVIMAESSEEFIDLVAALSSLPGCRGGRTAIMTLGGGWGVVAADACDREGVELTELPGGVIEELDTFLPKYWSRGNPVDIVGNLRRANHFRVIEALLRCDEVDILIIMGTILGREFFLYNLIFLVLRPFLRVALNSPARLLKMMRSLRRGFQESVTKESGFNPEGSVGINPKELRKWTDAAMIRRLRDLMAETGKPVLAVSMSEKQSASSRRLESQGIFTVPTPERAVRVASRMVAYAGFLRGKSGR